MTRDTVKEARNLGLTHGWQHAAFTDACGDASDNGRSLDEIKDATRAGGYDSQAERAAYSEGFDEGMQEFADSQDDYDPDGDD
jgi:hypothetical protein